MIAPRFGRKQSNLNWRRWAPRQSIQPICATGAGGFNARIALPPLIGNRFGDSSVQLNIERQREFAHQRRAYRRVAMCVLVRQNLKGQRLQRIAYHIIWVNPLKVTPGYAPLARGMAAALPFVDSFVEGHSMAAMEELATVIATERRS